MLISQESIYQSLLCQDQIISGASLIGANLSDVNLDYVNLQGVKFGCEVSQDGKTRVCSDLNGIKWNDLTNWENIQGWEYVQNIPPKLMPKIKTSNKKYN
jgi:hypothetical protein